MPRARRKRARRRRRKRASAPRAAPAVREAETRLLALARELTGTDIATAVRRLAAAHAPDAPLPRTVARAWIQGRDDTTAALALAWAREQVRLALEEVLARAHQASSLGGSMATRAWLLLAAAESIAQEPFAAADRLATLLELSGAEQTPGARSADLR